MSRRFVNKLSNQETIDQVFLASDKQLRANRQGSHYIQIELSDCTGTIPARMWNATEDTFRRFENGDFVRVKGSTQLFQGAIQLIVTHIDRALTHEVNEDDFVPVTAGQIDALAVRLGEILRTVSNPHLANLIECYLADEEFMAKFTRVPAGVKIHHAFRGGLLEHVTNVLEVIDRIADRYPQIDKELLLVGAFLHDSGKVVELSCDRGLDYTDEGQLIGHIVSGVGLLEKKIAQAEALSSESMPEELILQLKHMIVSHHGCCEHGSPKFPMTIEAIALHYLDNLDAKIQTFDQLIHDDLNTDSAWTQYQHNMERKLFKGRTKEEG